MRSRVSRIVSLVGVPALVAGLIGVSGIPAAAETTAVSVPIVTEIQADNTGYDNFEYIEVTNPTDTAIDFAESGYSLSYRNGSTSTELTTAMMDGSEGTPTSSCSRDRWLCSGCPTRAGTSIRGLKPKTRSVGLSV